MSDHSKFIVVFKKDATDEQINEYKERVKRENGEVTHEYDSVLRGFAAKLTPELFQSFQSLVGDSPGQSAEDYPISYIEPDGVVTTQ